MFKGHKLQKQLVRDTVPVLCKLYHSDIHLHKVSRKYHKTDFILQTGHKYITEITIFKVQRAITPKVTRVTVLVFCTSSHDALHLCEDLS